MTFPSASLSAVSLLTAAALAAGGSSRTLTHADAISSLRAVGVTKTYTIGWPSWAAGATINVTDGPIAAQPLIVRVFPSAEAARRWMAKFPVPSPDMVHLLIPKAGGYLPDRLVCNVLVGSTILPWLDTAHPTTTERRQLGQLLTKIAAAQTRVVEYLRRGCAR